MPASAVPIVDKSDTFMRESTKAWQLIKRIHKMYEPFSKASDAFDLAECATSGDLGAYTPAIEKLRIYVGNQKDKLADLARKDENFWIERSGTNLFDRAAMAKARQCFDDWINQFSQLKMLAQQLLPAAETARSILVNPALTGLRSALSESSLPALDGIAIEQVVGDLNNSVRSLDTILQRLRHCRLAIRKP